MSSSTVNWQDLLNQYSSNNLAGSLASMAGMLSDFRTNPSAYNFDAATLKQIQDYMGQTGSDYQDFFKQYADRNSNPYADASTNPWYYVYNGGNNVDWYSLLASQLPYLFGGIFGNYGSIYSGEPSDRGTIGPSGTYAGRVVDTNRTGDTTSRGDGTDGTDNGTTDNGTTNPTNNPRKPFNWLDLLKRLGPSVGSIVAGTYSRGANESWPYMARMNEMYDTLRRQEGTVFDRSGLSFDAMLGAYTPAMNAINDILSGNIPGMNKMLQGTYHTLDQTAQGQLNANMANAADRIAATKGAQGINRNLYGLKADTLSNFQNAMFDKALSGAETIGGNLGQLSGTLSGQAINAGTSLFGMLTQGYEDDIRNQLLRTGQNREYWSNIGNDIGDIIRSIDWGKLIGGN